MIGCINKHWGLLKGETFVSEKETHRIVAYWQPLPPRPTIDYCRFCKKYGVAALHSNVEELYRHLLNRDKEGARRWSNVYLAEAINGTQQIYEA